MSVIFTSSYFSMTIGTIKNSGQRDRVVRSFVSQRMLQNVLSQQSLCNITSQKFWLISKDLQYIMMYEGPNTKTGMLQRRKLLGTINSALSFCHVLIILFSFFDSCYIMRIYFAVRLNYRKGRFEVGGILLTVPSQEYASQVAS